MDAKTGDDGLPDGRPTDGALAARPPNRDWWPEALPVDILHQGGVSPDPMGEDFDYAEAFKELDYQALKARPHRADDRQQAVVAGRLRPLRPVHDPHGLARRGHLSHRRRARRRQQRPAALRAAQQLAGQRQSRQGAAAAVADQAEVRQEHQLGRPVHPRRQRRDRRAWAGRSSASAAAARTCSSRSATSIWGAEEKWVSEGAETRIQPDRELELEHPLAAIQMGLIYVNPEGPGGNPDPLQSARDIKITFERMAMNHEETVALTAGGHTFGKAHGARRRRAWSATRPRAADIALQGLGWPSATRAGSASTPSPAASRGRGSNTPTKWSENYFRLLLDYEYELVQSPGRRAAVAADQPEAKRTWRRRRTTRRSACRR